MLEEELLAVVLDFLRQVHKLHTLRLWEREAAKALRNHEFFRAEMALKRIRDLTEE